MTSKEALDIIVWKHCALITEELEKCYKRVISDLEVLEALKENYSKAIKRETINDMELVDVKVKEWLEK